MIILEYFHMEYFPFIGIDKQEEEKGQEEKDERMNKKDSSISVFDNQKTTTTTTYHCYYKEDPSSTPPLSKCDHKYFSGVAESSKLVCDSCNEIIGEWKFSVANNVKRTFPQPQYLIYKIYPYLRRLTVQEVQDLI